MSKKEYEDDFRKTKPSLHLLYVKTAVKHLHIINKTIATFSDLANTNMMGCISALMDERDKLINTNAAYADADEIIKSINDNFQA